MYFNAENTVAMSQEIMYQRCIQCAQHSQVHLCDSVIQILNGEESSQLMLRFELRHLVDAENS